MRSQEMREGDPRRCGKETPGDAGNEIPGDAGR